MHTGSTHTPRRWHLGHHGELMKCISYACCASYAAHLKHLALLYLTNPFSTSSFIFALSLSLLQGVGLGFAVAAAAVAHSTSPNHLVVAVEGDSAFGFSGMELETLVR